MRAARLFLLVLGPHAVLSGLVCPGKTLPGSKTCCTDSGLCSSSSCTVFGFKNSAKANCHTSGANANCLNAYCAYDVGSCKAVPGRVDRCYGHVACRTQSCSNVGQLCLDDGNSTNFKICGEDSCPTGDDGTCECPCGEEHNSLGDCVPVPAGRRPCCPGCGDGAVCEDGVCKCQCGRTDNNTDATDGCPEALDNVCCPGNPDCGPHSYCKDGKCICECGWEDKNSSSGCESPLDNVCCPGKPDCGPHSYCKDGKCICECGWEDKNSSSGCESQLSDACCPGKPDCGDHAYCLDGQCHCECGYEDLNEDRDKSDGDGCETAVPACCDGCPTNQICREGKCECDCGLLPPDCLPPVQCNITTNTTELQVDETPRGLWVWRPGPVESKGMNRGNNKHVREEVGSFTLDYIESSNTFTMTFDLNKLEGLEYPTSWLKFKKVWPRLRAHKPTRFDTKWLRNYTVDSNVTFVRYEGIQIPDFVCERDGATKYVSLLTQLQYWVPNNGVKLNRETGFPLEPSNVHYRTAHGYIDDGSFRTGRQRREYVITIHCGGTIVEYSGNCVCNPNCTKDNEICDLSGGSPTCECKPGFQRDVQSGDCIADSCAELAPMCPDNSHCLERGEGNGPICKCDPSYHPIADDDGSLLCVRKCVLNGATGLKAVGIPGIIGKLDIEINDLSSLEAPEFAFYWTLSNGQVKRISAHVDQQPWMSQHVPLMYNLQAASITKSGVYRYPETGFVPLQGAGPIDCSKEAQNVLYVFSQMGYITTTNTAGKAHGKGRKAGSSDETMAFEFRIKCLPACPAAAKCHSCHSLAECVWDGTSPEDNKYGCRCVAGYKGNGLQGGSADGCFDENECNNGAGKACGLNTICTNTVGSFQCACSTPNKMNEDAAKGGCCNSGDVGCFPSGTTQREAIEEGAGASVAPAEGCMVPSWVWIMMGVLITALVVMLCVVIVQHRLNKRCEVPFITTDIAEPRGHPVPAPSAASTEFSPSIRQRHPGSQSVTPTGRENPMATKTSYNPLHE